MEFKSNATNLITELDKTTILIGENGSGKTTIINKLKKTQFINDGSLDQEVEVLFAGVENVKDDVDATKANYKKSSAEFTNLLENIILTNKSNIDAELKTAKNEAETVLSSHLSEEIISQSIKMKNKIIVNAPLHAKSVFEFEGYEYELKKLPSGVRKLIHLYFSTKQTSKANKKLILLDEVDSMLHPSWVKLVSSIIKNWIQDSNSYVVISTHKPEMIHQLNNYFESFAKVNTTNDGVVYFRLTDATARFNSFNNAFLGNSFSNITEADYKNKLITKFSFQISRMFFSIKEDIVLTEGLTDQMFFKNKTQKLVVSTYGYYQIGLYLSILEWVKDGFNNIFIICDGDNKLLIPNSKNALLKDHLDKLGIHNYFFDVDIERTLFGDTTPPSTKLKIDEKFRILESNYSFSVTDPDLKAILD